KQRRNRYVMKPVKSINFPPLTRFGGRPSRFTFEARTVILDPLRAGKAYASACLAASITPVTLFKWRRAHPRFDAQCRAARATGKKLPQAMPAQWTMIDSNGNIVPDSGIVADEKERFRLIRLREHLHGLTRSGASQSRKRLLRRRDNWDDEVVKRLLKLREDYEADQRRAKAESSLPENVEIGPIDGNTVATPTVIHGETTVCVSVQDVPAQLPGAPSARPKQLPLPKHRR